MKNLSRTLIFISLALVFILVGCSPSNQPGRIESAITNIPSETALPASSNTDEPVEESTPEYPTFTLTPTSPNTSLLTLTDQARLLSNLSDYPILESGNLDKLRFLVAGQLDPGNDVLEIMAYDWSNNGSLIVTCTYAHDNSSYQVYDLIENVRLAEIETSKIVCKYADKHTRWLRFSREGDQFFGIAPEGETADGDQDSSLAVLEYLSGNQDSIYAVFDSLTGEQVSTLKGIPGEVVLLEDASFSSKGTRLALSVFHPSVPASTADANVQGGAWINNATAIELVDVQTGEYWGSFLKHELWFVSDLAYSTEGEYLVIGLDEVAQAWHVEGTLRHQVDCIWPGIRFSPAAETVALSCSSDLGDPYHLLWDLESANSVQVADAPGVYSQNLRFSQDGGLLIGLSEDGEVSIWEGNNGEYLSTLPYSYPTAVDVHFIGDGRLIAVLLDDGRLKLFGVE